MLKAFLKGFQRSTSQRTFNLKINVGKEYRSEPFEVEMNSTNKVSDLREAIFDKLSGSNPGMSPSSLALLWRNKRLNYDHFSLAFMDVRDGDEIVVSRASQGLQLYLDPDQPLMQPIPHEYPRLSLSSQAGVNEQKTHKRVLLSDVSLEKIAADPTAFQRLYDLLSPGSVVSGEVWDILMLLPTNRAYLNRVTSPALTEAKRWEQIFDASSMYKLLYALQAVDDVLQGTDAPDAPTTRASFCQAVAANGGVEFLAQLVIDGDLKRADASRAPLPIFQLCQAMVFKILARLFAADPAFVPSSPSADLQLPKGLLVSRGSFASLCAQLISLAIVPAVLHDPSSESSGRLLPAATELMVGLLQTCPALLPTLTAHPDAPALLCAMLLRCNNTEARDHVTHTLLRLSLSSPEVCAFMVRTLAAIVQSPTLAQHAANSEQLFYLLTQLCDIDISPNSAMWRVWQELSEFFITFIFNHRSTESYDDPSAADAPLVGGLALLRAMVECRIIQSEEQMTSLLTFVYQRCLLCLPSPSSPASEAVCRSLSSRQAAYALLVTVARASLMCRVQLLRLVAQEPLINKSRAVWNYDPAHMEKRPIKYVGLKNQGATCYMNSFLQQLFHVPAFRRGVLAATAKDGGKEPDESWSLLRQMQILFGQLKHSQKKYYDTLSFCQSMTDFSGQPINVGEQQDVNEFGGLLFDRLDTALKNSSAQHLLSQTFRGSISHQFLSRECAHHSERDEPFEMISLVLKNKANLQQAMDLFVEGDLLDGENKYQCSRCQPACCLVQKAVRSECVIRSCLVFRCRQLRPGPVRLSSNPQAPAPRGSRAGPPSKPYREAFSPVSTVAPRMAPGVSAVFMR